MAEVKATRTIDFISKRHLFGVISAFACVASLVLFISKGLNYGIDFLGGTEIQLQFTEKKDPQQIRGALSAVGMQDAVVQVFGAKADNEFLIRVPSATVNPEQYDSTIRIAVETLWQAGANELQRTRYVGDKVYLTLKENVDEAQLLKALKEIEDPSLSIFSAVLFGKASDRTYLVTFSGVTKLIIDSLEAEFGKDTFSLRREDTVGPKVGKELRSKGISALLFALVFILIYIWLRFDMTFAPGAILALMHDVLITVGVFSLLQVEVNLPVVAALLTIVGYSLNDTIVVYDRIRENLKKRKGSKLAEIINVSVNQTLGRTLMTSITTLLVTVALFFFGGAIIHNFALALTLGVTVGTYSSIFVASPTVIFLSHYIATKKVKAA